MPLLLFLCILLFPCASPCQENILDPLVVTASRIEETQAAVPQQMTIIDSGELAKNQYKDLAGLLQAYGFSMDSYGPAQTSSQISIRGMASSYSNPLDSNVLVLVNSCPVATANLAQIPMEGIERIEIMRGPGAVQYGSSALGGVVNIIPKKGSDKPEISAEAGYGSWESVRLLGSAAGRLRALDFAGAVAWNDQQNNYTTGDGKLYQDTAVKGRLSYLVNTGFNFDDENRLGAVILGSLDQGLGLSQDMTKEQKYNGLGVRAKRVNSAFSLTYDGGSRASGLGWKASYYNAYDQFKVMYPWNFALDTPYYSYSDYVIDNWQSGGGGQLSWTGSFLTLTGGADYNFSEYSSGFAPRYQQMNPAIWGLLKLSFLDERVILNAGARYDSFLFRVNGRSRDLDNTSLSAGILLRPFEWLFLRANIGQSYKAPSGLYVVGYEGPNGVKGNPDLSPERGLGWDAGSQIQWRGLNASLNYFAAEYRDKILPYYIYEDGYSAIYHNQSGKSFINGLEGSLGFDLGEFYDWDFTLKPYLNFTRLFEYRDANGKRLQNTRELTASFGINFNMPDWGLDADLRFTYLGWQHEQNFSVNYPYPEVRDGNKLIGDFFISKTLYEKEDWGKLSLKGEIRNFTNENYAYRHDYPLPGRSFYAGIRYDY